MKSFLELTALVIGIIWTAAPSGLAQPAFSLDPAFRPTITAPGGRIDSVIPQPDGKFIVFGEFHAIKGVARNNVARLNSDGSLDESFDLDPLIGSVGQSLLLPDGKLVLTAAKIQDDISSVTLVRLLTNGQVDPAFVVSPDFGTDQSGAIYRMAIQPDGKLLLGGWFNSVNGVARRGLARLNSDGSTDLTFDAGRGLDRESPRTEASAPEAIVIQADGKILLGGSFAFVDGVRRHPLARLNPDGTVDVTFNPGAIVQEVAKSAFDGNVLSIVLQSSGKIVVAGNFTRINGLPRGRIARLNQDGALDSGFRTGPGFIPFDVRVQARGIPGSDKVLVWDGSGSGPIFRLDSEGLLDPTWTPVNRALELWGIVGGRLLASDLVWLNNRLSWHDDRGRIDQEILLHPETVATGPVTLQPDGRILFLPQRDDIRVNGVEHGPGLARLNADGTLDPSIQLTLISTRRADPRGDLSAYALMPDGKIVIGGDFTSVNGIARDWLARLNADGTVDKAFNPTGVAALPLYILAQSGGHIVVRGGNGWFRLTPDGGLDSTFAVNAGILPYLVEPGVHAAGTTIGSDNRFLAINQAENVIRLNPDGTVDDTFAPLKPVSFMHTPMIVPLPDGKYMAPYYAEPFLVRLNREGSLDSSFTFNPRPHFEDGYVNVMALSASPEGKIVVGLSAVSFVLLSACNL